MRTRNTKIFGRSECGVNFLSLKGERLQAPGMNKILMTFVNVCLQVVNKYQAAVECQDIEYIYRYIYEYLVLVKFFVVPVRPGEL